MKQKIQDFLDRSSFLEDRKRKKIQEVQNEADRKLQQEQSDAMVRPTKLSEKILEVSKKYKNTTLLERRNLYMDEKRKHIRELKKSERERIKVEEVPESEMKVRLARRGESESPNQPSSDFTNPSRSRSRSRGAVSSKLEIDLSEIKGSNSAHHPDFKESYSESVAQRWSQRKQSVTDSTPKE